jgi:transposase
VNGQTHCLLCFTNGSLAYYQIGPSRGHESLQRFFNESFQGTLITDFWAAYNRVAGGNRQMCLVHLLRGLESVDQHNTSPSWIYFYDRLKLLLNDAIRLSKLEDCSPDEITSKCTRMNARLDQLANETSSGPDARRLIKHLAKYRHALLTFLDDPGLPFDNNPAEREIRPAVLMRKNSFHNMSQDRTTKQAVLMTIYQTLKLRGHDPTRTTHFFLRLGRMRSKVQKDSGFFGATR